MFLQQLREKFRRRAEEDVTEVVFEPEDSKRTPRERLEGWLDDIFTHLSEELKKPFKEGGPYHILSYEIDVKALAIPAPFLAGVQERIKKLHGICMSYDVHLEVAGFNVLESDGVSTSLSWHKGPAVVVLVDTGRTYNHFSHPEYSRMRQAGIDMRASMPRAGRVVPEYGI